MDNKGERNVQAHEEDVITHPSVTSSCGSRSWVWRRNGPVCLLAGTGTSP